MMTPLILLLIAAVILQALALVFLGSMVLGVGKRIADIEWRLENAQVSISTFCGAPAPHTHSANIRFPAPTRPV